jgi:hypothetical protein
MRLPLGRWLVTGIVSLCSTGALAADTKTPFPPCTTAPTEADRKAAQGAFAAGQGSFNEADYATAITYWRDAYRRDCTAHALLLNLARAYELKTDRSEAVNALETYLQRKPDAPDADQIRRRIDNLKSQMVAAAPQPVAPVAPPPTIAPVSATPIAPEGAEKGHGAGAAPFIIVGAGGVIAIVGAVVLAGGAKKVKDAEDACPNRKCPAGQEGAIQDGNDGRNQETIGGVVLGIGVAAVAGGLVWHFVSKPSNSAQAPGATSRGAGLTPVVSPGFAGLSLAGSF